MRILGMPWSWRFVVVFGLCAVLAGPAHGVILHDDSDPVPGGTVNRPVDALVGRWGSNASCVVVSPNHVITTQHQGGSPGTNVVIGGVKYVVAQVSDGDGWRYRLRTLPLLVLLGMGLALSNTQAVLKAILGRRQAFRRTPKYALHRPDDAWVSSAYALTGDGLVWVELSLAIFALTLLASPGMHWGFAPWLMLYAGGFGYVATINLQQVRERRRWLTAQPRSAASRTARTRTTEPNRIRADSPGRDR